mgnify:CR=1 FL=1|tara:strand:+ start:4293 stop:5237 length:945 start_codon:yes stop_codon:yes gene_type:complete
MAVFGTYYIDSVSFATATGVFTDAALTTCAPDGYYSDGLNYRYLTACVLGPVGTCPACTTACGTPIAGTGANDGSYMLSFTVGTGIGAIIITVTPGGAFKPVGVDATFNSSVYNKFSTTNFGYKGSTVGGVPTYLGDTAADCGIVAGSPYTLQSYTYAGGVFTATGLYVVRGIVAGQVQTTVGTPGASVMVVPKTLSGPTTIALEVVAPCPSTSFTLAAACPVALTGFTSTLTPVAGSGAVCLLTPTITYYNAPVTGTAGNPALHDWIFADPNGEFKVANSYGAGYYKWDDGTPTGRWFLLDANSVIIGEGACP